MLCFVCSFFSFILYFFICSTFFLPFFCYLKKIYHTFFILKDDFETGWYYESSTTAFHFVQILDCVKVNDNFGYFSYLNFFCSRSYDFFPSSNDFLELTPNRTIIKTSSGEFLLQRKRRLFPDSKWKKISLRKAFVFNRNFVRCATICFSFFFSFSEKICKF